MFSAGVILYGILTGLPLFKGTSEEVLEKNEKCEFDLSSVP
jgi:hypothetical protein